MSAETKIRVVVPEHITGDVMGRLSSSGASLDGFESSNGRAVIRATASPEALSQFEQWLRRFTNGEGSVEVVAK